VLPFLTSGPFPCDKIVLVTPSETTTALAMIKLNFKLFIHFHTPPKPEVRYKEARTEQE